MTESKGDVSHEVEKSKEIENYQNIKPEGEVNKEACDSFWESAMEKDPQASEIDVDNEEGNPRKIKTINDSLEGQNHPETGVPYVRKTVETDTGEKVEGVFPQFESAFDAQLPEDLLQASDKKQFDECNRQLKEKCNSDPELRSQFASDQLADIEDAYTPEGYTWHHDEEKGKMQLVESETHWNTRHTGGKNIWGGGTENRH